MPRTMQGRQSLDRFKSQTDTDDDTHRHRQRHTHRERESTTGDTHAAEGCKSKSGQVVCPIRRRKGSGLSDG